MKRIHTTRQVDKRAFKVKASPFLEMQFPGILCSHKRTPRSHRGLLDWIKKSALSNVLIWWCFSLVYVITCALSWPMRAMQGTWDSNERGIHNVDSVKQKQLHQQERLSIKHLKCWFLILISKEYVIPEVSDSFHVLKNFKLFDGEWI